MRIKTQFPGSRATGRRKYPTVFLEPEGARLRFEFRYVLVEDDDGERELVCLESGVAQLFDDPDDADADDLAVVTPAAIKDFRDKWPRYERVAHGALAAAYGVDARDPIEVGAPRPRERRVLSDDFLAGIVRRHREYERQGQPATAALAREELVGTSTVRNWLRKARARGIEAG